MSKKELADIHAGEAYMLWGLLVAYYDTFELVEFFRSVANDKEFIFLINTGIDKLIKPHINKIESVMNQYKIPLPSRPPDKVNLLSQIEAIRDESMYKIIFALTQTALNLHIKAINMCVNDPIRHMFMEFLKNELKSLDNLVKFGKQKNWNRNAPSYYH